MLAAIYVRVSTDQQAEKGYSISGQLEDGRKRVAELGITQFEEFVDEGYSGAYLERPGLDKLREGLREGRFTHVIVYDPDRLSRNLAHQLLLTDEVEGNNAQLIFVNFDWQNTPDGKLFFAMRGAIAAYEREKTRERSLRGKKAKASKGKVVINTKPYGYDWDADNSTYTINETEAEMIRQIFNWCVDEGLGIRAIATKLAQLGYPTRTGKGSWNIGTVHDILTRESYAGIHWAGREYKTKIGQNKNKRGLRDPSEWIAVPVPAIVSRETWDAAQRQLIANKRITKQPILYNYLCRRIVVCPLCGEYMRSVVSGTRGKPYYVCKTGRAISGKSKVGGSPKCPARQVPAQDLDEEVWHQVVLYLRNIDALRESYFDSENRQSSLISLSANLDRLRLREEQVMKERAKITILFRQDLIDLTFAEKQLNEVKLELSKIQEARSAISFQMEQSAADAESRALFVSKVSSLIKDIDTDDPNTRLNIIKSTVRAVSANRTDKSVGVNAIAEIVVHIDFFV